MILHVIQKLGHGDHVVKSHATKCKAAVHTDPNNQYYTNINISNTSKGNSFNVTFSQENYNLDITVCKEY